MKISESVKNLLLSELTQPGLVTRKRNRFFLDIQVGNARQRRIIITAWAKANGLGNILSGDRFTGAPIFTALAVGRVDGGQPVFNDLEMVTKHSYNQASWTEKCDKLLAMH